MKIVIAQQGDRFDTLAFEVLGDAVYTDDIMQLNNASLNKEITPGSEIILPEDLHEISINNSIVPPWQR